DCFALPCWSFGWFVRFRRQSVVSRRGQCVPLALRICTSILEIDGGVSTTHSPCLTPSLSSTSVPRWRTSVILRLCAGTQQFQYTTCSTRQHGALRAGPRQNANAEQDTQKDFGQFGRRASTRDRAVLLSGLDASPKEGLDEDHFPGDNLLEFGIIGCQFERCVNEPPP